MADLRARFAALEKVDKSPAGNYALPVETTEGMLAMLKTLESQMADLRADVATLKKAGPIPAGNDGQRGPPGPPGKIDYGNLPPITVRTVKDGKVIETVQVHLGGVLSLKLIPVESGGSQ